MAEPDKDLPLVVAEILIELHGMNGRFSSVENRLVNLDSRLVNLDTRLANVENILVQVVDNIQQLSAAVKLTAEQDAKRQEVYNRNFQLLQEADQRNTEMLATALQNAITTVGRRFDNLENRLERLENR